MQYRTAGNLANNLRETFLPQNSFPLYGILRVMKPWAASLQVGITLFLDQ